MLSIVGAVCILVALLLAFQQTRSQAPSSEQPQEIAQRLEAVMPPASTPGVSSSTDADGLPMVWLDDASYVGVLTVSSKGATTESAGVAGSKIPVCAGQSRDEGGDGQSPYVFSGTPNDCLVISDPGADGYLSDLWNLEEGQELTFADMNGSTISYRVKAHVAQNDLNLDDQSLAGSRLVLCSYDGLSSQYHLVCCVLAR